jgi:UDP-GlcNAc:undecaprenyl-phosphate/decaprenyl-phosphate GlcNAc-1-phosphate transferase
LRSNFSTLYESGIYLVLAFLSFFIVAFLFSVLINGLFLRFSKTLGMRNHDENIIRWNSTSKPAFGGISFYIVFLISMAALSFIFQKNDYFHNLQTLGILAATTLGFLMGLFDDAYNTRVFIKLSAQISCSVILIITGTYIHVFDNCWLNYVLTIIWVVGLMNSINMLDNMDGITTIVALFIFITSLILLFLHLEMDSAFIVILIGMIAAMLGFLFYNWYPSKMYMGDTGSQFLGSLLAIIGILFFWNQGESKMIEFPVKGFIMAAMMFVLPISDTSMVIIKRIRKGKSPFVGGKDHTTHHFSYLGISDKVVAIIFMGISFITSVVVVLASLIKTWTSIYTVLFGFYFLVVFTFLLVIGNKKPR